MKIKQLRQQLDEITKEPVAVAFSGGVDSALLLFMTCQAARKNGTNVYAIMADTMLHPMKEKQKAEKLAREIGAYFEVVLVDELMEAGILENPMDRCYRCKKCLFEKIMDRAKNMGIFRVIEGTNEDDLHVYRPGIKALKEFGILSPLADAGFTKEEVRETAKQCGISVANKPSTPCMATRFPYGTKLTKKDLKAVEEAEEALKAMGFYNVRVRVHGEIARIEVDLSDLEKVLEKKEEIVEILQSFGYLYVTLDLEGFRSGSMDIHVTE